MENERAPLGTALFKYDSDLWSVFVILVFAAVGKNDLDRKFRPCGDVRSECFADKVANHSGDYLTRIARETNMFRMFVSERRGE